MKGFPDNDYIERLDMNGNRVNQFFDEFHTNLITKDVDENSEKFRVISKSEWIRLEENDIYVEFLKQKFPKTFEHTMNQFNEWKLEQNLNKHHEYKHK